MIFQASFRRFCQHLAMGICCLAPMVLGAATTKDFRPLHINCGGGNVTDKKNGITWISDKEYIVRGKKYRFNTRPEAKNIEGAPPADVYESVRRANVTYQFRKLKDGMYKLRLHFMDGKKQAKRSMDFYVDGAHLLQNLSVREAAGGANRAYVFEAIVEVKGGKGMEIRGTRGHGDDVFISALEILPAPAGSVATRSADTSPHAPADMAKKLREFAGGHVRLVWSRTEVEEDFYLALNDSQLVGYDTEDGKGERVILQGPGSYALPTLTPDGKSVVFTESKQHKCFVVGFDGTGMREIAPGYASDVWQDPATGRTWVYVRTGWRDPKSLIVRYDLNDPSQHEEVWSKSATGQPQISYFQLSGDGRLAADGFPWPQCGVADLKSGDFSITAKGCWPGVAPDDSHRSFVFTGQHTSIQFFDEPGGNARLVNLATVPGWIGRKLYHPRWTNDVRFITATAPQWMPETELYLGQFDSNFTRINNWFRITYNSTSDFFGDAWFENASMHRPQPQPGTLQPTPPPAPVVTAVPASTGAQVPGLIFLWENERAKNAILDEKGNVVRRWTARYEGETRPNRFFGADLRKGALVPDEDAAGVIANAIKKTGQFALSLDVSNFLAAPKERSIVAFLGSADGKSGLIVDHDEQGFGVRMNIDSSTPTRLSLGQGREGEHHQLVVAYADGKITGYDNGAEKGAAKVAGNVSQWNPGVLLFGRAPGGASAWTGSLENARVYDRGLTLAEVQARYGQAADTWKTRQPAQRVVVEAELLQASQPDDPVTIAPYMRSLGENVYRVTKVVSGELDAKEIVALQWVILGGKVLPSAEREEGKTYTLVLESADVHPQLAGEHRSTDIFEPEMPVFYDVGS
ncbi:malectin domain-containing carbohydrate-binding protein [Roseimicrobium sp. ORNL1]|uniref:malectin domain-containing carbohydrate-binding protein n=1 Tax=Roseimicrobium sp. ORNL1 TaxID=2711231 RepID=UPI00197FA16B|nr:malectin domain-containing carbohydrate-binding protein [Roseimicrobium sp. ORNL1]